MKDKKTALRPLDLGLRRPMLGVFVGAVFGTVLATSAHAQQDSVDAHIAAARAAAGEHAGMVDRLCPAPPSESAAGGPRPRLSRDRDSWYHEPVKVFDNLYYVGMTEFSSWAVTTSEGIIVIDPIFDYSVEAEVVDGLRTLGFDPADIRYVLVSHGHLDHAGGAKFLQETFGARVVMGMADWDMLDESNPSWKPRRDIEVDRDSTLSLGDTTLALYLTPGHTYGTISTLIPLRDGDAEHVAALWGGTLFNFGPDAERFAAYAESAERFRAITADAGADVLLSNHTDYDGSKEKLPAMANRAPGDPHPYVVGTESIGRYLTVAHECALAALATVQ
ncbi:MAG: MBL fold metallo-hydrolase [Gammaproteobacteria bacterium]|nr:MBL fold metallo-hydrolase [Gammaproteobacteria bacterium]